MKNTTSFKQVLFNLIILFIICMSPAYIINVYRCANILVNKDKYLLKKYKIDSISTGIMSSSSLPDEATSYNVFFNDKKEKLQISIVDQNRFSFSQRTNKIYEDFEKNILKENGWLNHLSSDSISVWQGPKSNLYGFKNEKELDVTLFRYKLIFNIFLILVTILCIRYFVNYKKYKIQKHEA